MSRLDDELKRALRRAEAPPGFADHVLARVVRENRTRQAAISGWRQFFTRPILRLATAAALSTALVAGGAYYRHAQMEKAQRAEGEAAKQQLMLALRIASTKLHLARSKVNDVSDGNQNRHEKE